MSRRSSRSPTSTVHKLDFDSHRKPQSVASENRHSISGASSTYGLLGDNESLLGQVVDGIVQQDRRRMKRQLARYLSFFSAMLQCLCAGSLTGFSLYGHLFIQNLRYTQFQVNAVAMAAEVAMYLFVPVFGYLVDRYSPRPVAFMAALLFGLGYVLAATTYRAGPPSLQGWPVGVMMLAFVGIGLGTAAMYLSGVTACVKNFGRGKHKGLAIALPSAAFGLSAMWQSQVGSRLLYEPLPDGGRGDVDVYRYFLFLGGTLVGVGLIGAMALRILDEEDLIDEAVEELARSGLLEDSPFFQRSILHSATPGNGYGTMSETRPFDDEEESVRAVKKAHEAEEDRKKTWLLNGETRQFLADPTMWLLAAGFFLVTGPVETYINNLGTIIGTFYVPPFSPPSFNSPATHVSILAIASTTARLLAGVLSDVLAPTPVSHVQARTPSALTDAFPDFDLRPKRFLAVSRVVLLLSATSLLFVGFVILATPLSTSRPDLLPLVTALVGLPNGASFSLVPVIISVVWGVENFGTNWGIVATMPAGAALIWSAVYSAIYQAHSSPDGLCWGWACYGPTAYAWCGCTVGAMAFWAWAWKGKGGWAERGIVV